MEYIRNYSGFNQPILENKKQADAAIVKLGKALDDDDYVALKDLVSPNFGYLPLYVKFRFGEKISLRRIAELNELMKRYKQLMSNLKINPLSFDKFETLDDEINRAIIKNENTKFAKSFISNKYKHLLNADVIELFGELKKHESSHSQIQRYLANKMAAYKTPEQLSEAIRKVIESLVGKWEADTQSIKIEMSGGSIVFQDDEYIVAKIPDYRVSNILGSANWCISRSPNYWNSYVNNFGIQYFIWNFTKDVNHKYSLIGVTVNVSGSVTAAHDKQDGWISHYDWEAPNNYSYNGEGKWAKNDNSDTGKIFPQKVIDNFQGPTRPDMENMITNGYKPNKRVLTQYNFTKEDILALNPYYYTTDKDFLKDLKSGKKNVTDFKRYIKGRKTMNIKKYRSAMKTFDYKDMVDLLDEKFALSDSLLDKIYDGGNIDKFLTKYGSQVKGTHQKMLKNWVFYKHMKGDIESSVLDKFTIKWSSFSLAEFLFVKKLKLVNSSTAFTLVTDDQLENIDDFYKKKGFNTTFNMFNIPNTTKAIFDKMLNYTFFIDMLLTTDNKYHSVYSKVNMGVDFIENNIKSVKRVVDKSPKINALKTIFQSLQAGDKVKFLKLKLKQFPKSRFVTITSTWYGGSQQQPVNIEDTPFMTAFPSFLASKDYESINNFIAIRGVRVFYGLINKRKNSLTNFDAIIDYLKYLIVDKNVKVAKKELSYYLYNFLVKAASMPTKRTKLVQFIYDIGYKTMPPIKVDTATRKEIIAGVKALILANK